MRNIYKVSIFNNNVETIINYPSTELNLNYLKKMNLTENAGQVSNFNFIITINNEGYNQITNMVTLITVEDFDTDEILFEGRVYDAEENMDNTGLFYKDVKCESEMAYLNDTCVRAWDIENMTVQLFMQQIIDNHNNKTSPDKQFTLGDIEYNNEISCQTKYENTLNCIISNIVNSIGEGYLRVRKVNNIRYLDYIQLYDGSSDDIVLGQNMKDLKWKRDTSNIITRVIPIGKDGLTISDVNNGLDYLDNEEAIGTIGIVEGKLELNDIDDANTLKTTTQAKLPDLAKAVYQLASTTLDLNKLNINPYGYSVGTDVNIIADAISFNDSYTIIIKETDLLDPVHVKITLNNKFGSITDRQLALQRYAQILQSCLTSNKNINTFSLEGIIDTLKNQILSSGSFSNAQVIEGKGILLENTNAESGDYGALYLGCGIFAIASNKTNGQWNWRTFGTGKGFVADEITSGIINANLIKTGTITSLDGTFAISLDSGHMTMYDNTIASMPQKAIDFHSENIDFYDWLGIGLQVGSISSMRDQDENGDFTGAPSVGLIAEKNCSVMMEARNDDGSTAKPAIVVNNYAYNDILDATVHVPFNVHDKINIDVDSETALYIQSVADGGNNIYGNLEHQGWDVTGVGNLNCVNLSVSGSKNCQQSTKHFGDRLFHSYELPEVYLGDLGFGQVINGQCVVYLDDIVQESINLEQAYHVKFYPEESCNYKIEKHEGYFIITTDKDIEFSWEIVAKRRGFEYIRFDHADSVKQNLLKKTTNDDITKLLDKHSSSDLADILLKDINLADNLLNF